MKGFRIRRLPIIIQNMEITAEELSNFGLKPRPESFNKTPF